MVNMSKINYAPQLQDLYDWLRKVMEKNTGTSLLEIKSWKNITKSTR